MRLRVVFLLLFANVLCCTRQIVALEDCGGGQACVTDPSTGRAVITAVYIGCWDNETSFGANKVYFGNEAGANLTLALLRADLRRAPYLAVARVGGDGYGYTFDQLPTGNQSSSDKCNATCWGDSRFACGCGNSPFVPDKNCGPTERQWAVYSIPAYLPTVYLGCFDDTKQFGNGATYFNGSDAGYYSTAVAAGLRRRASHIAVSRSANNSAPQGGGFAFTQTISFGANSTRQCGSLCSGEGTGGKSCGCAGPTGGGAGQCGTAQVWAAYALPVGPPGYSDGIPRNWAGNDIMDPSDTSAACDATGQVGSSLAACAALCSASTLCKGFLLRFAGKCCYLKSSFPGPGSVDGGGYTYLKDNTALVPAPTPGFVLVASAPASVPASVPALAPALPPALPPILAPGLGPAMPTANTSVLPVPTVNNASTITGGNSTSGGGGLIIQNKGDKGGSNAAVIGVAVGGPLAVITMLGLAAFLFWKQRKRAHELAASWLGPLKPGGGRGLSVQSGGARRVPYVALQSATQSFCEAARLGSGGFGDVYKAHLADLGLVAVKRSKAGSKQGEAEFLTEVQLLSRLHHTNLVQLLGFCDDQERRCLVYQFVPNGNLRNHLDGECSTWQTDGQVSTLCGHGASCACGTWHAGGMLSWAQRVDIALGAARALDYLHTAADPPVIHRDVKSSNILLDQNCQAKVADFGLSRLIEVQDDTHVSTLVKGTQGYLDPDYVLTNQLTCGSDVWSFGVVLLELLTGRPASLPPPDHALVPWALPYIESGSVLDIVDPRLGGNYPPEAPEKLAGVAQACLIRQTALRPTMADVAALLKELVVPLYATPRVYTASPVYVPLAESSFSSAPTSSSYGGSERL